MKKVLSAILAAILLMTVMPMNALAGIKPNAYEADIGDSIGLFLDEDDEYRYVFDANDSRFFDINFNIVTNGIVLVKCLDADYNLIKEHYINPYEYDLGSSDYLDTIFSCVSKTKQFYFTVYSYEDDVDFEVTTNISFSKTFTAYTNTRIDMSVDTDLNYSDLWYFYAYRSDTYNFTYYNTTSKSNVTFDIYSKNDKKKITSFNTKTTESANTEVYLNKGPHYIIVNNNDVDVCPTRTFLYAKLKINSITSLNRTSKLFTSVSYSWNAVDGVDGYAICRWNGNSYDVFATTSNTSFTIAGLNPGTSYKFSIRCYKNYNGSVKYSSGKVTSTTTPTYPQTTTIKKLKGAKKSFSIAINGRSNIDGYQVQYSLKKNMKGAKSTYFTATSGKIKKGIKRRKTYYVRVRTYKYVEGKAYYSGWSKVKKVKVK